MKFTSKLVAVLVLAGAISQQALAQNQVPDNGRTNPAPWRPSFGKVDKDALSTPPAQAQPRSQGSSERSQDFSRRSSQPFTNPSAVVPPAARPNNPNSPANDQQSSDTAHDLSLIHI